jgi:hypothetical protein
LSKKEVDGRDEAGHDEKDNRPPETLTSSRESGSISRKGEADKASLSTCVDFKRINP